MGERCNGPCSRKRRRHRQAPIGTAGCIASEEGAGRPACQSPTTRMHLLGKLPLARYPRFAQEFVPRRAQHLRQPRPPRLRHCEAPLAARPRVSAHAYPPHYLAAPMINNRVRPARAVPAYSAETGQAVAICQLSSVYLLRGTTRPWCAAASHYPSQS